MSRAPSKRDTSLIINGKWILLALLLTAIAVPLITWGVLRAVEADMAIGSPPLSWAARASWPSPPIKRTTLERPRSNYGGYTQPVSKWRELDFQYASPKIAEARKSAAAAASAAATDEQREAIERRAEHEVREISERIDRAIQRCATLARAAGTGAFTSERTLAELQAVAAEHPWLFYPPYLIGTWHRLHGDHAAADRWYEQAYHLAPAVLKVRYRTPGGQPVEGLELGTFEITCDRVIDDPETEIFDGELDQTLKLVYPALATGQRGAVYLPVFHTVYRATKVPEPKGIEIAYRQLEGWFQFPGRIGSPKPATVTQSVSP